MFICLSVYLPACLPLLVSVCLCLPICLSVYRPIYVPAVSVCLSVSLSVYPSVNPSVYPSVYPYVYPSVYLGSCQYFNLADIRRRDRLSTSKSLFKSFVTRHLLRPAILLSQAHQPHARALSHSRPSARLRSCPFTNSPPPPQIGRAHV